MTGRRGRGGGVATWAWRGAIVGVCCLFGFGGSVAQAAEDLRVGISESYPPLAFAKDGEPVGAEVDLARAVGKELGRKIVFVAMPFSDLVSSLEEGKVDVVMSGLSITEERSEKIRFADPYLRVGQMTLIRADDLTRSADPDEMGAKGSRVGVKKATTGEGWARANLPDATIVSFETVDDGVAALEAEQVDYFVHDAPTIWRLTGRLDSRDDDLAGIYRPLTKEFLAWAVAKDDEALATQLNHALKGLRGSGKLQEILDVWIPVTKVALKDGPQPTAAPAVAP